MQATQELGLSAKDLSVYYGSKQAVRNISLDFEKKQVTA